ncbi:MAG: class I SAM-dependent methyltransferase [Acidobacteriia bacterium]|nr:class I SAM-dependent methyltransferase [Terriglobia bacterium]MYG00901.1 class I SAM-dependent methyltransferase [Terriglobia bacterium]MYK11728.1 class I SAM-dependent methyltransferase [Terriglobia bacterium]
MGFARRAALSAAAPLAVAGMALSFCASLGAQPRVRVPLVDQRSVAPYVPMPWHVVDRIMEVVEVSEDDVVYDLGSGDGRILLRAAKSRGARGVGYEIDPALVEEARSAISAAGVQDRVEVREGDFFDADLGPATVVTLFLITSAQRQLRPKLLEELRPGTRVACYMWEIPGWNPSKTVTVPVSGAAHPIYVYRVGSHQ